MVLRKKIYDQVLPQLPKKWLSHYLGAAVHQPLPRALSQAAIKAYVKMCNINLEEIEKPLSEYKTLGEFFSRALKDGARPIQGGISFTLVMGVSFNGVPFTMGP